MAVTADPRLFANVSYPRFPLQPYRSKLYRFSLFQAEQMTWTQKKTLRFTTIRLKWKLNRHK